MQHDSEDENDNDESKNEQLKTMPRAKSKKEKSGRKEKEVREPPMLFMVYPIFEKLSASPSLRDELQNLYDRLFDSEDMNSKMARATFDSEEQARNYPLDHFHRKPEERDIIILKGGTVVGFIDTNKKRFDFEAPSPNVQQEASEKRETVKDYLQIALDRLKEIGQMNYDELRKLGVITSTTKPTKEKELEHEVHVARKKAAATFIKEMPYLKSSQYETLISAIHDAKQAKNNKHDFSYLRRETGGHSTFTLGFMEYGDTTTWKDALKVLRQRKEFATQSEKQDLRGDRRGKP